AAIEDYRSLVALGSGRADAAALRGGLLWLAEGNRDSAGVWFERSASIAARFWGAVLMRSRDRVTADSLLRVVAGLPGYDFYSVAARETLGLRGWPGAVASDSCG